MIIVLFGQPCSGKTTLAKKIQNWIFATRNETSVHHIDGDEFRQIFSNTNYSREGRIQNLNLASSVAHYEHHYHDFVLLSFVYPYQEAREHLTRLSGENILWIYLHYDDTLEERGRESYHAKDFEYPLESEVDIILNTGILSEGQCLNEIISVLSQKISKTS
jgi:adenylylsulfate kinase-like enzyme